tara:strand:+ start:1982 stop:2413 length:432 start_codon:yes stop_codon:yes gene_type:complete
MKRVECITCQGYGLHPDTETGGRDGHTCSTCDGEGTVPIYCPLCQTGEAMLHTVVQHSAYGYGPSDPQFAQGLESRHLETKAQRAAVEKAGGILFDSYLAAEEFADAEQYPDGYEGMTPIAPGAFARTKIDGLKVYIPKRLGH